MEATVGNAITLRGNDPALRRKVTVQEVLNPAQPASEYVTPAEGNKYVAVRAQLENVGQDTYNEAPLDSGRLITAANEQFQGTFAEVGNCQTFTGGTVTIPPGTIAVGCLPYELPQVVNPGRFQFHPRQRLGGHRRVSGGWGES